MPDNNEGTPAPEGEAPVTPETAPAGAEAPVTPPAVDEVTTLKSRNAGLDAKVTTLTQAQLAEKARADEAERKLNEYLTGKANESEETRALLLRLNEELAASKLAAKVAGIGVKFPETYSVLGDAVASMTEDQLAAAEARFLGVPVESNRPPQPVGNNAARPSTAVKTIEEMTLAELKEYSQAQFGNIRWDDIVQSD